MRKYTVKNTYGIKGDTTHRTPEAALKACDKREGEGWIVVDTDGNRWDWYVNNDGEKEARLEF